MDSLGKIAIENYKGKVKQLTLPYYVTKGLGVMNPSIYNDNGTLKVIIRALNYILYHNESQRFQHEYGPLQYIHPEEDRHLRTYNYYAELDNDLNIVWYSPVDFGLLDNVPQWTFVGLEDARLFNFENDMYICGVRRDTTTNGEGRMELCRLKIENNTAKVNTRQRIPAPPPNNTYCEKNWAPVLGKTPLTFVKWHNPIEVVQYFEGNTKTVSLRDNRFATRADLRGSSQVIPYRDGYISITHEVYLHKSELGSKNATYRHRFVFYDKDFNITKITRDFCFMSADIEFCCGLAQKENKLYASFGFQDNSAFVLEMHEDILNDPRLYT